MTDILTICSHVLLGIVFGGTWVLISTIIAEKFGSKLGGLIGGLPSTVFVSLLIIGVAESPAYAAEATSAVPLAMGMNGVFLVAYATLARLGFVTAICGALAIWITFGLLGVTIFPDSFLLSIIILFILLGLSYAALERWLEIRSFPGEGLNISIPAMVGRASISGLMIGFSVFMAQVAGPRIGGLFATFPAVFLATIIIGYYSKGLSFSLAVAKPLIISGMVNVTVYASAVRIFYPQAGIVWGTIISLAFSVASSLLTYTFIKSRLS
jgi:hypothetical protein